MESRVSCTWVKYVRSSIGPSLARVPRVPERVKEIGNEPMLQSRRECEDVSPSALEIAGRQEQSP